MCSTLLELYLVQLRGWSEDFGQWGIRFVNTCWAVGYGGGIGSPAGAGIGTACG